MLLLLLLLVLLLLDAEHLEALDDRADELGELFVGRVVLLERFDDLLFDCGRICRRRSDK